jgi:hypothetical protein
MWKRKIAYSFGNFSARIVRVIAGWEFSELVYEGHPLHRPSHGYPETVAALTRGDLLDFHARFVAPNNTILSMVGDFNPADMLSRIERYFGTWQSKPLTFPSYPNPKRQTSESIRLRPPTQPHLDLGIQRSNQTTMHFRYWTQFWVEGWIHCANSTSGCGTNLGWPIRRLPALHQMPVSIGQVCIVYRYIA